MSDRLLHDELEVNGAFDLRTWRRTLQRAAECVDAEAICPFGFEILGQAGFLRGPLDRLYVLLRLHPRLAAETDALARKFIGELSAALREFAPKFSARLSLIRLDGRNISATPPPDVAPKMLNVRTRISSEPAIVDYARYVVAAVDGILSGELGEATAFATAPRARRRVFQLFQMVDYLAARCFGTPRCAVAVPDQHRYAGEVSGMIAGDMLGEVSDAEAAIYSAVVRPKLETLQRVWRSLNGPGDILEEWAVPDMFTDGSIRVRVSRQRTAALVEFIARTYAAFPEVAATPQ